jgi:dihydroorotate dehydrogenase electron transfer subunit
MPALVSEPAVHTTVVSDRREAAPDIVIIGVHAPQLAAQAIPGQFVMVIPPTGERAATALGIYEAAGDRISLMVVECGPRTHELAGITTGSTLSMLGPLGNGFAIDELGDDVAIVAGGVGLASVLLAAQVLAGSGKRVHLYYGARTARSLVDVDRFTSLGIEASLATDDGSLGHHGYVTDVLAKTSRTHSAIVACGPSPMLRSVARVAATLGVRAQLSLEETFACGVGACWGCVVRLDPASRQAPHFAPSDPSWDAGGYVNARICKEGPVFWAHELKW